MTIAKTLAASVAAMSLAMASGPAFAGAKRNAASKLSLAAAQSMNGVSCVTRPGVDGEWVQNAAGNWARCGSKGGFLGGNGVLIGLGVAVAVGIGVGVASGGSGSP